MATRSLIGTIVTTTMVKRAKWRKTGLRSRSIESKEVAKASHVSESTHSQSDGFGMDNLFMPQLDTKKVHQ